MIVSRVRVEGASMFNGCMWMKGVTVLEILREMSALAPGLPWGFGIRTYPLKRVRTPLNWYSQRPFAPVLCFRAAPLYIGRTGLGIKY